MPQKQIADLLNLTEPAISQYKKGLRGDIKLDERILDQIRESAKRIVNNGVNVPREVQRIIKFIQNEGFLCEFHRKFGSPMINCTLCADSGLHENEKKNDAK